MGFKTKYWLDFNFNKWGKDMPDCAVRSLAAGTGLDYEAVCKKLGVKCIPGKGFADTYGIDLDIIVDRFKGWLGPIEDMLDKFEDPVQALTSGQPLFEWLELSEKEGRKGIFLVYLDDNTMHDGGHIVCCSCQGKNPCFIDTDNVGNMFVQCWCKVLKKVPESSSLHWKYDHSQRKFL